MASNIYGVGLRNVGSYQVAGAPYLTASVINREQKQFSFPKVTKKIIVENTGSQEVHLFFTDNSQEGLIIPTAKKIEIDVKCTFLYASSSVNTGIQVFAELTNIPANKMYSLVGLEGI